ncbi:oligosaccharide flippase family protein [Sedimentitalea sp. XS_ASV28]|uniref:oligosaccharide flippase family protein n=1 Tax=Sedimentitalea sp. XS_ASV28 TaxID=3241296 RepID=UPI003519AE10
MSSPMISLRQKYDKFVRGDGTGARATRSSAYTMGGYMAAQAIRLGANLILTRLLFPEAFGLMALVMLFLQGLQMFSDVGVGPSIMQNRRGDEPDFLNTAWTIQVIRGSILWLATLALAVPVARFYGEPQLAQLMPVAGFSLFIAGFNSTRIETAHRHMTLGRVTLIDLSSQALGAVAMIIFALIFRSVWALLVASLVAAGSKALFSHLFLPGHPNRLRWEKSAGTELIHFGKWIFLSTMCGFIITQGDRLILGKFLSIGMLGIYNIGHFLASFPFILGSAIVVKIMIPLYRDKHPSISRGNFKKIRMVRMLLTITILSMAAFMALAGVKLTEFLYDPRFYLSGPVLVLVAIAQFPLIIGLTYDQGALAAGDSRGFFWVLLARSTFLVLFLFIGMNMGGLVVAILMVGLGSVLSHGFLILLARKHGVWDPLNDAVFFAVAAGIAALALWLNQDAINMLWASQQGLEQVQ